MKKALKGILSIPSAAALSVTAFLMGLFFREAEKIPISLALWTATAACTGLVAGAVCLARRNFPGAAGLFLISAIVPLGLYSFYGSFSAEIRLGLGEPSTGFENISRKPLAKPPTISLAFDGVKEGKAVLKINGLDVLLDEGERVRSGGFDIKLKEISFAPLVAIKSGDTTVAECLLKASRLKKDPPAVFDILPHKFMVKNIDQETIDLTISRGKLKVSEKQMKSGEQMEFEGFNLSFSAGERFVVLLVGKPFKGALFGALAVVVLFLLYLGARRDA